MGFVEDVAGDGEFFYRTGQRFCSRRRVGVTTASLGGFIAP